MVNMYIHSIFKKNYIIVKPAVKIQQKPWWSFHRMTQVKCHLCSVSGCGTENAHHSFVFVVHSFSRVWMMDIVGVLPYAHKFITLISLEIEL